MMKLHKITIVFFFAIICSATTYSQHVESIIDFKNSENYCPPIWQDAIFGECMGFNNSIIPFDYDDDGIDELIVNANVAVSPKYGFWYILKFNEQSQTYHKVYTSPLFDNAISKMVVTTSGDFPTLCMSFEDCLYFYNLSTLELVHKLKLDKSNWVYEVRDLDYRDINNDGYDDIFVNGSNWLKIIDGYTFETLNDVDDNFWRFDIGNVDSDNNLELVFSNGVVYDIDESGALNEEYYFDDLFGGSVDIILEDIDGDGKEEGILGLQTQSVNVLDLDTESVKYKISLFSGAYVMKLKDTHGDGVRELVLSNFNKDILIYDLKTQELLETFETDENKIPSIAISDFDNDGKDELVYTSTCNSSKEDYLYILSLEDGTVEFRNIFVEGKFYGIEIEDLDNDGIKELITLSGRNGNKGGTLSVYDAKTKDLKFRSEQGFFPELVTDAKFFEVLDFGNDGDLDIVIGGGLSSKGRIWVVDGSTYELELAYVFMEDVEGISSIQKIENESGHFDLIIVTYSKLYRISGIDFSIIWASEFPMSVYLFDSQILLHDLFQDGEMDLIIAGKRLWAFSSSGEYIMDSGPKSLDLVKSIVWGDNDYPSLIAGRHSEIIIYDDSLKEVSNFLFESTTILNIAPADFNNDGINELIIGTDKDLTFLTESGKVLHNTIGKQIGEHDGMKYLDYDDDGVKDLIVGTVHNVMEVDLSCVECLFFQPELVASNPKCNVDNGIITVADPGNYLKMEIDGVEFTDMVDSLEEKKYSIVLEDVNGCTHYFSVELFDEELKVSGSSTPVSCPGYEDGAFYIDIISGKPDYTFLLNGEEVTGDSILNLSGGSYTLVTEDANQCKDTYTFNIFERIPFPFETTLVVDDPTTEEADGSISIVSSDYSYLWENGSTNSILDSLEDGAYSVTLTDYFGCEIDTVFYLGISSLNENLDKKGINLYPNPSRDLVNVELNSANQKIIRLISISGAVVNTIRIDQVSDLEYRIDIENVPAGLYFIEIEQEGFSILEKLIIQN